MRAEEHTHRVVIMRALVGFVVLAAGLGGGCGGDESESGPGVTVKVMTRNVYLGSELEMIVSADTIEQIPPRVATFWQTVKASDFRARAKLLADEIAAARPDLIGLQEVELFRTQTPSDFDFAAPALNATEIVFDYLAILQTELQARGALYQVAATNTLTDAEMPGTGPDGARFDLRMTDRDVILVREGLAVSNARTSAFAHLVAFKIGGANGVPVRLPRGYGIIDVELDTVRFTFVNTHLEVGGLAAAFQESQARELVTALSGIEGPVLLVGDLNSAADRSGTRSYEEVTKKFKDAYAQARPNEPGLTCCTDLRSATFMGRTRIDLLLHRGRVAPTSAEVVGTDPAKKTPAGLWPSDHAGVIGTVTVRN